MADNSPKKWFKLEESFFNGVDQKLLDKLRKQVATEEQATAIQRLTGLSDIKVCQAIAELNISAESLAALRLAPLVAVAWADDRIEDNERFQVVQAAEKAGLVRGEASYELLVCTLLIGYVLGLLTTALWKVRSWRTQALAARKSTKPMALPTDAASNSGRLTGDPLSENKRGPL